MTKVNVNNGQTVIAFSGQNNLLEALESCGVNVNYHCREGFCGACRCKLTSGTTAYNEEPLAFVRKGEILLCCSRPTSDIAIEVDS